MSASQGDKSYAEAEKKLKGSFMGMGKDPDAAVDCFKQACNNYKVHCFGRAGRGISVIMRTSRACSMHAVDSAAKCQERVAAISEKQGEFYEVAAASMEAAKLYIKGKDMRRAVAALQKARNLYVQHGKISQAARACKELATALKQEGDRESAALALESFMEAARMYETDSSYSEMHKMKLEAASMKVEMRRHKEASQLFEEVGNEYVANNLLKYSAKDHFMNALLCIMAEGDTTAAMQKREEYRSTDVNFEGSRQDKLISECVNAMLGSNPEDFASAVAEWESLTKLDPMRVKLLLAAKDTISVGGPDLLDDGDDLDLT